ncbi:MAG: REP-associated tyrosine transposase [Terriglobales bacterium]
MDSKRTFFVTSVTAGRRSIFRVDRNAELLLEVLLEQRTAGRCWLHEFVVMRDHFHLLVTPSAKIALERLMQFIKGGFSYRYGRMANSKAEIWQKSFTLRRIMNAADYAAHAAYIRLNPVRAGMVADANDYLYSSANPRFALDPAPQGLKPRVVGGTKTPA